MRPVSRYRALLMVALALVAFDLVLRVAQLLSSPRPVELSSALGVLEWQEPLPADQGAVFYVIFQPADCVRALESLQFWNELQLSGTAPVRGVMVNAPEGAVEREAIIQRAGIKFPVAAATGRMVDRVLFELGYGHTLVAILVDREGIIRLTMPAGDQQMDKLAALKQILVDDGDSTASTRGRTERSVDGR